VLQFRVHTAKWVSENRAKQDFLAMCISNCIPVDEIEAGDEIWSTNNGQKTDSLSLVRDGNIVHYVD